MLNVNLVQQDATIQVIECEVWFLIQIVKKKSDILYFLE
jgi:hypothetical protein